MMCAKIFPLGLLVFTLLGCNQSRVETQISNVAQASTISQQRGSFSKNPSTTQANEDKEPQAQIDDSSYENVIDYLGKLTKDCEETQKTKVNIKYTVCIINGQPVKASESHAEIGDGLGYWFDNGKVRAIRRFHSEELFIFDNSDNLKSVFFYNANTGKMEKLTSITDEKSQFTPETLNKIYKNILGIFNL